MQYRELIYFYPVIYFLSDGILFSRRDYLGFGRAVKVLGLSDSISWSIPSLAGEEKGLDQTKEGQQDWEAVERFQN